MLAVALGLVAVGATASLRVFGGSAQGAPVRVEVPSGAAFRTVAAALEDAGVVRSARAFGWYAAALGRDRGMRAGTYSLHPGQSWSELLTALESGIGSVVTVTIPEGFDTRRIVPRLASALQLPEDSIRAALTDSAWRAERGISAPSLEGYLFPDTYTFAEGVTARAAVSAMLSRFDDVWQPDWDRRTEELGITRHEAVTMASLVEKEARVGTERPIIAAVYWDRVKRNMLLQADPTVQYALPQHVERVLFKHLEVDSPYNTYRYAGLPPGPIASPGAASLEAALYPVDATFLYFVAHPDGHHEFRNTFAEHQQAIAMVRREARRRNAPARTAGRADDGGPQ